MKKIILGAIIAFVALCGTSCSDDDTTYSAKGDEYMGTLTTERTSPNEDIIQEDVSFYLDIKNSGGSLDLYMPDVTFFITSSYTMPRLDLVLFSIPQTTAGDATSNTIYSAESVVIYEIEDREVLVNSALGAYSGIKDVTITIPYDNANAVEIEFTCTLSGSARIVTYSGAKGY